MTSCRRTAFSGIKVFSCFTLVLVSLFMTSHGLRDSRASSTTRCRPITSDPEENCNITTNCRYGGTCRKVADVSSQGTTVRFIVPSDVDSLHSPVNDRAGEGQTMYQGLEEHGKDVCVCDFDCSRELYFESAEVCGSDKNTYISECHLKRDACRCQVNLSIRYRGPCISEQAPTEIRHRTDVRDDRRHKIARCTRTCSYGGVCNSDGICVCDIECSGMTVSYVCGGDGRTYTNRCHVQQAQCRRQEGIDVSHNGPCRSGRPRPERSHFCDSLSCNALVDDPVCGTDGQSYPNVCVMMHASCVRRQDIEVRHKQLCQNSDLSTPSLVNSGATRQPTVDAPSLKLRKDDPCYGIACHYDAVCVEHEEYEFTCSCDAICDRVKPTLETPSTTETEVVHQGERTNIKSQWSDDNRRGWRDGVRIRNNRPRRRRQGRNRRRHRSKRTVDGPRPLIYDVLCGSDGKTYDNECVMKIEACHNKSVITIVHQGPCVKAITQRDSTVSTSTVSLGDLTLVSREDVINTDTFIRGPNHRRSGGQNRKSPRRRRDRRNKAMSTASPMDQEKPESRDEIIKDVNLDLNFLSDDMQTPTELRDEIVDVGILNVPDEVGKTASSDSIEQRDGSISDDLLRFDSAEPKDLHGDVHREVPDKKKFKNDNVRPKISPTGDTVGVLPVDRSEKTIIDPELDGVMDRVENANTPLFNDMFGDENGQETIRKDILGDAKKDILNDTNIPLLRDEMVNETVVQSLLDTERPEATAKNPSRNFTGKNITENETLRHLRKLIWRNRRVGRKRNDTKTWKLEKDGPSISNTNDGNSGKNVVALTLAVVFGQVIIVTILIGIFLYMKKKKKFKDLPDKINVTMKNKDLGKNVTENIKTT